MTIYYGVFPPIKGEEGLCQCAKCFHERREAKRGTEPLFFDSRMILCATCGNKRCPHATDHMLDCSGSNLPGQRGSSYE